MNQESSCVCDILTLSENVSISAWSDFSETSNSALENKVDSRPLPRRSPAIQKGKKFGVCGSRDYLFRHHESSRRYIQDYNDVYSRCTSRAHPVIFKYDAFIKLQLPPYVEKPHTGVAISEKSSARLDNSQTINSQTTSTVKDSKKLLTYEDIKDYVEDECEDDQESNTIPTLLKPRKPININLTGKFVQRVSSNTPRSTTITTKVEVAANRKPNDHTKLPVPLKPAPLVSYKMPSSLRCKVTIERPASQSAKTHSDVTSKCAGPKKRLPYRMSDKQIGASLLSMSNERYPPITRRSVDSLMSTSCSNAIKTRPVGKETGIVSNSPDDGRRKQLHALVKILGSQTLTPYLNKVRHLEEKNVSASLGFGPAEAINYNIIFGSRI